MDKEAVLPNDRKPERGLRHEGFCRRQNLRPSTLPRDDGGDHSAHQSPCRRQSVRSGMDQKPGPPSSLEAFRQTVRCQPMVLKNGLSRMRGDSHVRLLGGGAAMRRCYPTPSYGERDSKTAHTPPTAHACLWASGARRPGSTSRAEGVRGQRRMAAIRHEARGAAREPDGGTPGRTYVSTATTLATGSFWATAA